MVISQGHGGDKNSRAPERPAQRQQRRVGGRSPGHFHRRQSKQSTGFGIGMTMAPTASTMSGLSTPSRHQTPGRQSTGSGSVSGRSRSGSIGGSSSSHGGGGGGGGGGGSHEEGGVRVVVRVRPLGEEEDAKGGERTMRCCNPKALEFTSTPALAASAPAAATAAGGGAGSGSEGAGGGGVVGEGSRQYTFDLCAHEGFNQEEMFQSCGLMPLLSAAINGYAGTVFAYGATGAGKTYTMSGREQVLGPSRGPGGRVRPGNNRGKAPPPAAPGRAAPAAGVSDGTEGLVPRSMRFLFQQVSALPPAVTMRIRASFYEIYNEVVYDLLTKGDRRPLQVRYDVRRGFFVQGLFEVEIRGLHDIMAVVDEGNGNRRVSSHLLNKDSSRSHSLLTVYLDSERKDPEDGHLVKQFGNNRVSFVDLAGSERLKKSKATNEKETGAINKSLMTLGKVISALSKRSAMAAAAPAHTSVLLEAAAAAAGMAGVIDNLTLPATATAADSGANSRGASAANKSGGGGTGAGTSAVVVDQSAPAGVSDIWVPYRDSTLTKLLMDSLGGNGLTLMVACVSPSVRHAEESAATLNYAARARNIRNRPLVRVDARERLINGLRREVNLLREENELLRRNQLQRQQQQRQLQQQDEPLLGLYSGGAGETLGVFSGDNGGGGGGGLFAPDAFSQNGLELAAEGGSLDGGGGGGGAAVPEDRSLAQKQEPATAQIGQASRDVALLLRKYEEECHRLRNEAAYAQHKEQEIGKQTRQALVENDALSRTVERLQRSFSGAGKAS
ncbi:unnamed protein product [Ectocarpus sp. CCAP 1310/34]|nr:unnamed protein product [Ectocarpus sp. CCAP 1310/34]